MFEKLKEYWLYIILWLIALWVLWYVYVTTINNNKWADFRKNIQYTYMDWIKLKDELWYKNKTVLWLINDIDWKTFSWKHVDWDAIYLINQDWLLATTDWRLPNLLSVHQVNKIYFNWDPSSLKLFLIPLVNSNLVDTNNLDWILELREDEINEINESWWLRNILTNLNSWNQQTWNKNIKDLSDFSRWYIWEWYFGLWLFDTQQEATDFANSYFNWAEVVQVSDDWKYWIFFEIVWWWNSTNYNIDTLRCDWVTRETQNQLNTKNEQVNELLARELDYINTINEKNQALIDKEQEKNTAVNQCLQQKQEAIEAKEQEKTEAVATCNSEKTEIQTQCNADKQELQQQLTALTSLQNWATWNIIMNWNQIYQWSCARNRTSYEPSSKHHEFSYQIWDDYYFWFFKDLWCHNSCSWKTRTWIWSIVFKLQPNWTVTVVQWPTWLYSPNINVQWFTWHWYNKDWWLFLIITASTEVKTDRYRDNRAQRRRMWYNYYYNYYVLDFTTSWINILARVQDTSLPCWTNANWDDIWWCYNNHFNTLKSTYWVTDQMEITDPKLPYSITWRVHNINQFVVWWRQQEASVFTWK